MILYILLTVLAVLLTYWYLKQRQYRLQYSHIPGPEPRLFWGNAEEINKDAVHLTLADWHKDHGPVYRIFTHVGATVVCGDLEGVHEILYKRGADYAGRSNHYREQVFFRKGGMGFYDGDDPRYKTIKNVAFRQIRPYGEGRRVMSSVIEQVTRELWDKLSEHENVVFDPLDIIFKASLKTIGWFCLREELNDDHPLATLIPKLLDMTAKTLGHLSHGEILDRFPWMRPIHPSRKILAELDKYLDEFQGIMRKELAKPFSDSYPQALSKVEIDGKALKETDIMGSLMEFCVAGIISTSFSFYTYIARIKKRPDLQEKMYEEIISVLGKDSDVVAMEERSKFPFMNAVLLESLRHHTIGKTGVPHKALKDTYVKGYFIPKGTRMITNLYHLHYDKAVWGDPEEFRPERFLDEDGDLLPVDHKLRRHVVMFGAGPRVCVGEALAVSRLFIWMVSLTQKYIIQDADTTAQDMKNTIISRPSGNDIVLIPRN